MNKIVCDICGSSYSDTEAQCPICGTARSEEGKPVVETTMEASSAKTGKYSKTNSEKPASARKSSTEKSGGKKNDASSNKAMIAVVAVLLLAIVAVIVVIAVRMMGNNDKPDATKPSTTVSGKKEEIECEKLVFVNAIDGTLSFAELTESFTFEIKTEPENCTEKITFKSADPSVAKVDKNGKITPVANGETTVSVSCGEAEPIVVTVKVSLPDPTLNLELAYEDVSWKPGNPTLKLYNGKIEVDKITWKSSDDTIATVKNGEITALKNGTVTITATYGEQVKTCKVHISGMDKVTDYAIRNRWNTNVEATMVVDEKLKIWLYNTKTGEAVTEGVTWEFSSQFSQCCTYEKTENGIQITATKVSDKNSGITGGYICAYAVYEGQKYEFKIFVKAAPAKE